MKTNSKINLIKDEKKLLILLAIIVAVETPIIWLSSSTEPGQIYGLQLMSLWIDGFLYALFSRCLKVIDDRSWVKYLIIFFAGFLTLVLFLGFGLIEALVGLGIFTSTLKFKKINVKKTISKPAPQTISRSLQSNQTRPTKLRVLRN
jgi:hypothetical protein